MAGNHRDLSDAVNMISAASDAVDREFSVSVVMNREIAEEAASKAEEGLDAIPGIPQPNALKVAAQYAFWVRKLKPCRVLKLQPLADRLKHKGVVFHPDVEKSLQEEADAAGNPLHIFVNELIAVRLALSILEERGFRVRPSADMVHDLITTLRYHSFSSNSIRMILEGMVQAPAAEEPLRGQ